MWTVDVLVLVLVLVLSFEEREVLERRVRALTTSFRDRQRAQVVLLAADGVPGNQIGPLIGLSVQSAGGQVGVDGESHAGTSGGGCAVVAFGISGSDGGGQDSDFGVADRQDFGG
jgi:hypothetical protein